MPKTDWKGRDLGLRRTVSGPRFEYCTEPCKSHGTYCTVELTDCQIKINSTHLIGLWKKTKVLGENPHIDGENMQTPHKQALVQPCNLAEY